MTIKQRVLFVVVVFSCAVSSFFPYLKLTTF